MLDNEIYIFLNFSKKDTPRSNITNIIYDAFPGVYYLCYENWMHVKILKFIYDLSKMLRKIFFVCIHAKKCRSIVRKIRAVDVL